ncbi:MAG: hypothetical protein GTO63_09935 [Anaerolineae bacterium]|nr:hypothetical protein [Anaerolineae bacterium]NIN95234.1 hypothetical protein [Anaerolineae bacterium]NIQ78197.1 hypothetical protein [Anaerolineae bacterium]
MRKYVLVIMGLVLLFLLAALGTATASPDTITVDSTTDVLDAAGHCDLVDIGDLPGPDMETSLPEAICAANNHAGSDTIAFSIPVTDTGYEVSGIAGTWTISLTSSLPSLTGGGTVISGTTQPEGNADGPEIEISGADMGSGACLRIESAGNVIHGLVINRCPNDGITIIGTSATTNTVSGSYIGTDASGSSGLANGQNGVGVREGAQDNVIGGDIPEERNVISGNGWDGVRIQGAMSNTVSGNYIGTDASGTSGLGNDLEGVRILGDASNNVVGGNTEGERNIISKNKQTGVSIGGSGATGNTISGNYIGTDVTGTEDLGNGYDGVSIWSGAKYNTVGGDTEGERNVISGNDSDGVVIEDNGTMNNTVSGNFIGTVVTGTQALGNGWAGVIIQDSAQNNTIGGTSTGERNVVSGNHIGLSISGSGTMSNTVSGNYIGTDYTGTQDKGNTTYGVRIGGGAQNNTVGGDTSGERNVISGNGMHGLTIYHSGTDGNTVSGNYIGTDATGTQGLGNTWNGVYLEEGAQNNIIGSDNVIASNGLDGVEVRGITTTGNTISRNSIHSNGLLGIDNYVGGNTELPPPVIFGALCAAIVGTAPPSATVEIFTGPDGEGKTYLATASADVGGLWSIVGSFTFDIYVTATATDASGNTSEFSAQATPGACCQVFLPLTVKSY